MKKKWGGKKRLFGILAAAVFFSQISLGAAGDGTVCAESTAEIRTVNLNAEGRIAGIGDPKSVDPDTASYWSGSYVNFGSYDQQMILCRVLDANTVGEYSDKETMLLQSNSIIKKLGFREDYDAADASEWESSDVRKWLFEEMLPQFEIIEQKAVVSSTKMQVSDEETELNKRVFAPLQEDKLFLLDAAEASRRSYGYCTSRLRAIGKTAWWTRSKVLNVEGYQGAFCPIGNSVERAGYDRNVGVVPAWNVDLSLVGFAFLPDINKTKNFSLTESGSSRNIWNLTLLDGDGFQAGLGNGQNKRVCAGGDVIVEITALASGNKNDYTQISAMLIDENETVIAYGRAAAEIQTGELTLSIPEQVPQGHYTLKLFEESILRTELRNQTDYMSNAADIAFIVGETEPAETEPAETEPAETEPAETEPVETEPAETEPAETEPAETEPAETEPVETEPAETEPAETEPAETEPAETEPAETEPAEIEPAETKATEVQNCLQGTKIVKLTGIKKGFRVKWKRIKRDVDGYEIQYAPKRIWKGKNVRKVKIENAKTRKKKVTGVRSGKRYYVRIRSWKKTGKSVCYSAWSKVRRVKIKK